MTEQEKRAIVHAYIKAGHPENAQLRSNLAASNNIDMVYLRVLSHITRSTVSDYERMHKSVEGTEDEVFFLSYALRELMFGKESKSLAVRSFLDRYTTLTGKAFPESLLEKDFSLDLLKCFRDSPERVSAYLEANPVETYLKKPQIEKMGINTSWPPVSLVLDSLKDRSSFTNYSIQEILDVEDPEVRAAFLSLMVQDRLGAWNILVNAEQLALKIPDAATYFRPAIENAGMMFAFEEYFKKSSPYKQGILLPHLIEAGIADVPNALAALSGYLEVNDKLALPILNKIKPHVLDNLRENPIDTSMGVSLVINALHERPDAVRFSIVEGASAADLYSLIVNAADAHYTSTFKGLFNRFLDRLKNEEGGLDKILAEEKDPVASFTKFLEVSVLFDRFPDFLKALSDQDKIALLNHIVPDVSADKKDSVAYAQYFDVNSLFALVRAVSPNDTMSPIIESRLISNYVNSADATEKIDIGIAASWYINHARREPAPENKAFFEKFANDPKYYLADMSKLGTENVLLDRRGRNFQMHLFYNDDDGKASYKSFKQALEKDGWKGEKIDGFVKFSKSQNGRSVNILVSPPEEDGFQAEPIRRYVVDQGGKISVLVHRGHSYHVDKSLQYLDEDMKLVFLGSCGGQKNVREVVTHSPQAQLLSTAGTGRMVINNQSFLDISRQILHSSEVDWTKLKASWLLRAARDPSLMGDYQNYVLPYENSSFLIIKAREGLQELLKGQPSEDLSISEMRQSFIVSSVGGLLPSESFAVGADPDVRQKAANDPRFSLSMNS